MTGLVLCEQIGADVHREFIELKCTAFSTQRVSQRLQTQVTRFTQEFGSHLTLFIILGLCFTHIPEEIKSLWV